MAPSKNQNAKTEWKARAWHKITCPSGQVVEMRIPSLTELIRNEAVPERLRAIAIRAAAHPAGFKGVLAERLVDTDDETAKTTDAEKKADAEAKLAVAIADVEEITRHLIVESVRAPELTLEDLDSTDFPELDKELLGAIVLREADTDAKGVRLGVAPLDAWASFRHFHDCDATCGPCAALRDEFSTADLGAL